jgi:hypothetical protein
VNSLVATKVRSANQRSRFASTRVT